MQAIFSQKAGSGILNFFRFFPFYKGAVTFVDKGEKAFFQTVPDRHSILDIYSYMLCKNSYIFCFYAG